MLHLFDPVVTYSKHLKSTYVDDFSYKNHTILLSILSLLILFTALKPCLLNYRWSESNHIIASLVLALIGYIAFSIKKSDLPKIMPPLIYVSSAMASFYIITARSPFLHEEISAQIAIELYLIPIATLLCFIVGFWRPIFACFPLLFMNWKKADLSEVFEYRLFLEDFGNISEMGLIFICAFIILGLCERLKSKKTIFSLNINTIEKELTSYSDKKLHFLEYVAFFAIAVHLSNYFYSGWQKIILSPDILNPFYWVTENYTQYLLLTNDQLGLFPLSFNETLSKLTYQFLDKGYVILNILVLISQLMSLFILRNVRATLFITLFFDIMHIVIFLTTGIFFWKWILLNTSIVIGLTAFGNKQLSNDFKNGLCLVVLCAPMLFFVARLGWFDTKGFNRYHIEAITKNNEIVPLPLSYFWSASGLIGQGTLWGTQTRRRPFYFDSLTMAATSSAERMHSANNCKLWMSEEHAKDHPYMVENYNPSQYYEENILKDERVYKKINVFFQRHHRFILEKQPSKLEFYLYPHHFYAWWWHYPEFQKLDFNDIIGYRLNTEAVCLGFKDGEFTKDVLAKDSHDIFIK